MYNSSSKCHQRQQEWPTKARLTHQLADLIDLHKQFRISPRSKLGQIKFVAIWKRAWASSINLPGEFNLWIFHFDCISQKRIRRVGKLEAWNYNKNWPLGKENVGSQKYRLWKIDQLTEVHGDPLKATYLGFNFIDRLFEYRLGRCQYFISKSSSFRSDQVGQYSRDLLNQLIWMITIWINLKSNWI